MDFKFEDLVKRYGQPLLRFENKLTEEEKSAGELPVECCVFKYNHPNKVIAASRYCSADEWQINGGERAIIKYLLDKSSNLSY
jgi:hypothetical protein